MLGFGRTVCCLRQYEAIYIKFTENRCQIKNTAKIHGCTGRADGKDMQKSLQKSFANLFTKHLQSTIGCGGSWQQSRWDIRGDCNPMNKTGH